MEASKTALLSYLDPYLKEFQATVLERRIIEDGDSLVLDQTAFHPIDGGQESDRGLIVGPKGSAEIAVAKEMGGIVYHIIKRLEGIIEVDDVVRGEIDWKRRYGLMRHHTAAHILWATLERCLSRMRIVGSAVRAEHARFDVQSDREELRRKLGEIETTANRIVEEDRPVLIRILKREEAEGLVKKYGESPSILPPGAGRVRIVEVEDWDVSACKGIHVKRTGEVGSIKMLRRSSKGKKIDRLVFVVSSPC
jgi:Ser-tRNA(Ala) deacylase AlaX